MVALISVKADDNREEYGRVARRYPDLVDYAKREKEKLAKLMGVELRVVVPLIVGAWLGDLLVVMLAERPIPAFRKAGVVLLVVSLGYWVYRKLRWWSERRKIKRKLAAEIGIRELLSK